MVFIKFLFLTPILWLVQLLTYPLAPFAAATANPEGRLLSVFKWMETFDHLGWDGPYEEPATTKIAEKYGKRVALCFWLWRNKAYTFRYSLRVKGDFSTVDFKEYGKKGLPKFGPSFYLCLLKTTKGTYFEFSPKLGLGFTCLYFRIGWKLMGVKDTLERGGDLNNALIFTGITPRSDDWDG